MPDKENVVVVIPTCKDRLSFEERISLAHLFKYLGSYDKYTIVPDGIRPDYGPQIEIEVFDPKHFSSHQAHSLFRLSKEFYQRFKKYKYMLIYELDSLVFSDSLLSWCRKDYDFVGAPWFEGFDKPLAGAGFIGAGNSGFCLKNIHNCLKVLDAYHSTLSKIRRFGFKKANEILAGCGKKPLAGENAWRCSFLTKRMNADLFFGLEGRKWYPKFRVAPSEEALSFSFEVNPRVCFEMNGRNLPFGCHAWPKYDRSFWEPYLLNVKK